ncbi:hypothetical protein FRB99_001419 [Tulasnella sp. 403]|nr:hypothetical protein FRB99_001419 [Tulasnella sp. 403]
MSNGTASTRPVFLYVNCDDDPAVSGVKKPEHFSLQSILLICPEIRGLGTSSEFVNNISDPNVVPISPHHSYRIPLPEDGTARRMSNAPSSTPSSSNSSRSSNTSRDQSKEPHPYQPSPPAVTVQHPLPKDYPVERCFAWRTTTFRSLADDTKLTTTVCWRRAFETSDFGINYPSHHPRHSTPKSNKEDPPQTQPSFAQATNVSLPTSVALDPNPGPPPPELSFLRGRSLEIRTSEDSPVPPKWTTPPTAFKIGPPLGSDKLLRAYELRPAMLGFKWRSENGDYVYMISLGHLHHNIRSHFARKFDRLFGPTTRLVDRVTNRVYDSFASGKQYEAWNIVWNRLASGEGAKLWVKLCDQVGVMSERSKAAAAKKDDSEDRNTRPKI